MVEITKSILIKGNCEMDYLIQSDGPNWIAIYAREIGDKFDMDSPLLYLNKPEGLAVSRAISELFEGY